MPITYPGPLPRITYTLYAPTTQAVVAASASTANVDGTNAQVTATYGLTGKILIEIDAYYEFTRGADTVYWRVGGPIFSTLRAVAVGASAQKMPVHHTLVVVGGTPGVSGNWTLQHNSVSGNADIKIGGSGGGMTPPLVMKATPL